ISKPKIKLMLSNVGLNRLIILGFMAMVGFALAKSIQSGSNLGLVLCITSLGAAVYFLYLLAKMKQEMEAEENR
ncbi:MAG: hypothetical protein ABW007_10935, partial [Chitinophagaceae bacterium]